MSLQHLFLDILSGNVHFQPKEHVITHAVELPRSNKSSSCRISFKEAEVVCDNPGEEKTCGGGTGGAA